MRLATWRAVFGVTLTAMLIPGVPASGGSTIFVNDDAPAGGSGQSWATAYRYLQDALTAASNSGGAVTEIWVAAGTYRPDRSEANPDGTGIRSAAFSLVNGVALRGGFAGHEDPSTFDLASRVFEGNPSILSGDLAGDDGPDFVHYDENSYHVVSSAHTSSGAILDGFTISGGNANYYVFQDTTAYGGGLYLFNASPTLIHCTFRANRASGGASLSAHTGGGGLHVTNGSPALSHCTFSGNTVDNRYDQGGGMFALGGNPTLEHCTFDANSAKGYTTRGGGLVVSSGAATLTACTFRGNVNEGQNSYGGGMYAASSNIVLNQCLFEENIAPEAGGGLFTDGGSVALTECVFSKNRATSTIPYGTGLAGIGDGAGMYTYGSSSLTLTGCSFVENVATGWGAGLNIYESSPTLLNCVFRGNVSTLESGGGLLLREAHPTVINCAFVGNWAYDGGGLANEWGSMPLLINCTFAANGGSNGCAMNSNGGSIPTLRNCIVWGNNSNPQIRRGGNATYSCIQGGWPGEGNIDVDPRLVSAAAGDVRLGAGSPCIDAGNNAFVPAGILVDLAGLSRLYDDPAVADCPWLPGMCGTAPIVDMGAFESVMAPPTITQQPPGQTVCEGEMLTLTVAATGTGTLTYQWQKDGEDLVDGAQISGATTDTLILNPPGTGDTGEYQCAVTDTQGVTRSGIADVLIEPATVITQQPAAQAGVPAVFTVAATGEGALTYRWQRNGVDLTDDAHYTGTATPTLTIAYCASGDATVFRCVVTGDCGSTVSEGAPLSCQPGDTDLDTDVDQTDFALVQTCLAAADVSSEPACGRADVNGDGRVNSQDVALFIDCMSGADVAGDPECGQ